MHNDLQRNRFGKLSETKLSASPPWLFMHFVVHPQAAICARTANPPGYPTETPGNSKSRRFWNAFQKIIVGNQSRARDASKTVVGSLTRARDASKTVVRGQSRAGDASKTGIGSQSRARDTSLTVVGGQSPARDTSHTVVGSLSRARDSFRDGF